VRTVVRTDAGVLELNWMWLPSWIGMSQTIKANIEKDLKNKIVGMDLSEESLDRIDAMVIEALNGYFPQIDGLKDYLDGLKFIRLKTDG
jgi:hypothetical protein